MLHASEASRWVRAVADGAAHRSDSKNFGVWNRTDGLSILWFSQSLDGRQQMQEYRAYIIGPDGHVESRVDLRCADVAEAFERAKQLADGHDVELWQLDRQMGTVKAQGERDSLTLAVRAS
jgi:hypothetical protein